MKNTTMTLLAGLALATTSYAGEDYSAKGGKEIIAPPAPSCLWTWFAGGSIGQVSGDWDEEMYTLHFGTERKCPGSNCSHAFYLEVGFTEKDDIVNIPTASPIGNYVGRVDVEAEIIPITLNYKYECSLTDKLNWYAGVGAGIALVDLDINGTGGNNSFDDTTFYAHIFAGVVYNVSESFEVYVGARYIFMDDADLTGFSAFDDGISLDEDVQYELGARFNF
ncbi:MAG: outer membrane protein [Akkermansiaceae bacterium]